jgi:hypothetical protein
MKAPMFCHSITVDSYLKCVLHHQFTLQVKFIAPKLELTDGYLCHLGKG